MAAARTALSAMIDPAFSTDAMRAIFAPGSCVQRMLDFEAALARAEADVGVIPATAADAIVLACRSEEFDPATLAMAARTAGNKAIPLVAALTARVEPGARGYVHWGATSQDVLDTALVLQIGDANQLIAASLHRFATALARAASRHKDTPIAARTWMQQALPTTLGVKLAGTLSALDRHRKRMAEVMVQLRVLQFGGAAGTLASLGPDAPAVEQALAAGLDLVVADLPWHTQRDRLWDVAGVLTGIVVTTGKLARDIALLAQTEVAEAFEPATPGRGGSSTLPHKRNPVGCAIALAAAVRAPNLLATMYAAGVQEHERGLGNWPAEWDTLPDLFELAAGAIEAMQVVIEGLEVDAVRMSDNLDATQGQIMAEAVQMALAPTLGRDQAHQLVAALCRQAAAARVPVRELLQGDPTIAGALDDAALDRLLDPVNYLGMAGAFVTRVLSGRRER